MIYDQHRSHLLQPQYNLFWFVRAVSSQRLILPIVAAHFSTILKDWNLVVERFVTSERSMKDCPPSDRKKAQINVRSRPGEPCLTKILLNCACVAILASTMWLRWAACRDLTANKTGTFSLLHQSYYCAICGCDKTSPTSLSGES